MEEKCVRVGMLGAGFIGQMHSLSLHGVPVARYQPKINIELVAIADQNLDAANSLAERFGYQNVFQRYEDVVGRKDIDLFVNAAPNSMHKDPTVAAAKNGIHVFCEKPIAPSAEEAYDLYREVKKTGVIHMSAFMWRAIPAIRLLRDMVAAGEFGTVHHYRSTFLLSMLEPDGHVSWRFSKGIAGSGATGDLGSHHIDVCRFILGSEVERVGAFAKTWTKDAAGKITDINDDAFVAAAELSNGATASFEASRICAAHGLTGRVEIDGSKLSARFYMERLNEIEFIEPGKGRRTMIINHEDHPHSGYWLPVGIQGSHPHGWNDCFTYQDYRIAATVAGVNDSVTPYGADFYDAYCVAETVDTILRSSEEGKILVVKRRER